MTPGPDCSGWERDARRRKRREQRQVRREADAELAARKALAR